MTAPDRNLRLLAAFVAVVLMVGAIAAISRNRTDDAPERPTPTASEPAAAPSDAAGAPTDPPTTAVPTADVMTSPDAAEAAGAEALLALGQDLAVGDWADTGNPAWAVEERPVYVAAVDLGEGRQRVNADVVVAARADRPLDEVVLRLLPAAEALEAAGTGLEVTVRREGRGTPHEVDAAGARLLVDLDPPVAAGEAYLLRVIVSYDVVDRTSIQGTEGGPAEFGLLAYNPTATFLGHWLPLLTIPSDAGPMIPWGDVGAFPSAVWSVVATHDGVLVTGGVDGPCPEPTEGCTWARGVALRDVSAVAYDDGAYEEADDVPGLRVRTVVPGDDVNTRAAVTAQDETLSAVDSFTRRFGPLAWAEFDVTIAPLGTGAAGMEFPGLVVIDDSDFPELDGGFASFILGHEVAHQWFHALVGNGSLSSPVVDESLAQYLTYLWYRDEFGPIAAQSMVDTYMERRYDRYRDNGGVDQPPAQPLPDFGGAFAYGPMVYARAPLAWLEAETELGSERVEVFLRGVVERWGLGFVSDDELIAEAQAFDAELGRILTRYWLEPAPLR